jgi:predicted secreted acid phosphatase
MIRRTARRAATAAAVAAGLGLSVVFADPASAASTVTEAQWLSDVAAVTGPAQTYIDARAASSSGAKQAIVLDIDNTALESYFEGGYPTPATPPVLLLAKDAHARGVIVFFVTARSNLIDAVTKTNLTTVGYPVDGLYSRSLADVLTESVAQFKKAQRKKIEAAGYDIIANIGNNTTDLSGGYADQTFKLPDYDGLLD